MRQIDIARDNALANSSVIIYQSIDDQSVDYRTRL